MKLVKIEELEVGDEVVISCQSYFKYLRILRKPMISTKTHWRTGNPLYKSVKCSTNRSVKDVGGTFKGTPYTRIEKTWVFGPEDHNYTQYVDLEFRQTILVKKNNE
jgi:hypothetical protein